MSDVQQPPPPVRYLDTPEALDHFTAFNRKNGFLSKEPDIAIPPSPPPSDAGSDDLRRLPPPPVPAHQPQIPPYQQEQQQHPPQQQPQEPQQQQPIGLSRSLSRGKKAGDEQDLQSISIATSNPSHLFWVPAAHHPEIAPGEFEEYLRTTNALANRQRSRVKRRASILSNSFTAKDAQLGEEKEVREGTAAKVPEDDERRQQRRSRLRRSMSLDTIVAAENQMRNVPDFLVFDRNSSAEDQSRVLIPDRPSLLRRGARTKFQRNPSFKVAARPAVPSPPPLQQRQSEPVPPTFLEQLNQQQQPNNGPPLAEPMPMRRVSDDEVFNNSKKKLDGQVESLAIPGSSPSPPPLPAIQPQPSSTTAPAIVEAKQTSKPSWSWSSLWSEPKKGSKTDLDIQPRPSVSSDTTTTTTTTNTTPPFTSTTTTTNSSQKKFGLSSLFSRKTSSKEHPTPPPPQKTNSMPAPKDFQLNRINQNRLPIHLERAIYRLSHMKLANPRRPLKEQVLISNFMFWYLSIVNAPASQHDPRKQLAKKAGGSGKPRNNGSNNKAGSPRNSGRTPPAGRPNNSQNGRSSPSPANGRASPPNGHGRSSPPSGRASPPNGRASPPHSSSRANNGRASPTLTKKDDHADVMKRESTGFVVPENYLRPRRTTPPEDSDSSSDEEDEPSRTYHPHTPRHPSNHPSHPRSPQRRPQEDDVPLAMCRKK
ncbi:hypothetical protein BCR43DRAFT_526825 [Syncephalastrum racemosum]|uniref:Protein Zds1 C-terminal domain-containing protein n=1 Tax=Syncephalastrum racemosum TaxID=13706 RepID=A0A1X2H4E1_SYNRA|nr:hypothetical protein BCR43DRAFT_526825 [Syncephalastrum racemosum]